MNSQQELLNAINAINEKSDKSYDTPAIVLRVEGDTVWVHIDGGADETPVQRTINCEQGEVVQVRISNGSAFLVGNASAPPTDDKKANVAHFVAEQADIKAVKAEETATEVKETVEVLEVEVDGKVDIGTSNIQHLSSTMYQNANGVNIFNDELAVGDSYAHIDGDSFDIKEITTAGSIDDTNDKVVASFGSNESFIESTYGATSKYKLRLLSNALRVEHETIGVQDSKKGWNISPGSIGSIGLHNASNIFLSHESNLISIYEDANEGQKTDITSGKIYLTGDVYDIGGNYKKTPTVLTSSTISASTTSYTFSNSAIKTDSVIDLYDSIFGFSPTNMTVSNGSCTVTFPAQSSSHTIKLFVY